ncbi:N-6 DNA methylase [Pontixanthobacter aestiaquae]|uniref:site-specific DNA-methyltransferase (adenine-specific) n=1 Tax=Pontixanthobacter aestiaquae TaxID=1509367 RepID=A0A844Z681_9SPHN|nr:type ISP restriction/modification enzyme [Pontixanthobacter aestiaquae]MDN3644846.1 N-6 DNA methylase [Pontixanthobacter aestiaquae]MXO84151.1 N-6 DNA methylase [Pontixanthobacter aestiaquae]
MDIAGYLAEITEIYDGGEATEHSYRAPLQRLFESIDDSARVINEPKRSEGGMPDFLFHRDGVAFGWAEAKDLPKDVVKLKGYSVEQRKRYEAAYPNLLYTNGVDFEFIREGDVVHHTSIADFMGALGSLQPLPDKFDELERQLKSFTAQKPISIRSAQKLAEMMAGKAAIIKDEVGIALTDDPDFRSGLGRQFNTFKDNLLPNLTPGEFADIYAETITYGMFAARLHDDTLDTFSRQEALEKLPKSNPFLRGLFQFIAGYDIPDRLKYVVDDLAEVLRASDPHALFEEFGKFTARNDPFIHFYETFLAAYNPKKRKARGVWYTPEPVVDFIVRAVDDVLKSEFGIADGLADTGKVSVDWDTGQTDKKGKAVTIKKDVHRVQILDPATGTGTFLAKTVQTIADRVKARAPGKWSSYVEEELLPRLHGFELLMASYAMCHMKLDMQLTESGYVPGSGTKPADWPADKQWPPRLSVWLTNALEPAEREVKDLFFQQLADEARGASEVKRQTPIMCVIGNPPYSGESANKGDHIMGLMEAYKMEPGGKEKLKERNPKWINDDYVKFIRMSEDLIAKNPSGGVLGFITNHGYLDNPTFRGMRWHLLKTFDKIWVLDLHGNSKKKEVSPDGSPDKNVFDIQQGVALIVAVRKGAGSDELAEVWHGDLWGSRNAKSVALGSGRTKTMSDSKLEHRFPNLPFELRDYDRLEKYEDGFSLIKLLPINSTGVLTARDALAIDIDKRRLARRVDDFRELPETELRDKYALGKDSRDWKISFAKKDVIQNSSEENFRQISYRPLDPRWTYYTGNNRGFHTNPRYDVMRHFLLGANLAFAICRQSVVNDWCHALVVEQLGDDSFVSNRSKERAYYQPIYIYPDENADQADALAPTERTLNLDPKLYATICKAAGIDPDDTDMARTKSLSLEGDGGAPEGTEGVGGRRSSGAEPPPPTPPHGEGGTANFRAPTGDARPSEVKVFDYIYGVLHSPDYRETFAEFLKIDFPRIPYPANAEVFKHVSEKGEALRRLHLMEPAAIGEALYPFMGDVEESEDDSVVAPGYPKFEAHTKSVRAEPVEAPSLTSSAAQQEKNSPSTGSGRTGRVLINKHQYFSDVPEAAWNFYIGGYQPAQKWLKDRKGRALSWDDITHYQNIVKILLETGRIMGEIELPLEGD